MEEVLGSITQPALVMGIGSDILCPVEEQRFIARRLPNATLVEIDSVYGHDGFIVEGAKIRQYLREWV